MRGTAALWGLVAVLSAMPPARGLAIHESAPEWRAVGLDGKSRASSDFPGRPVLLLFWQPASERSRAVVCRLASLARGYEPAALVTIVSGPHERSEIDGALQACAPKPAVLLDADRTLFGAFQIVALPTLLLIGPGRLLEYRTAGFSAEGIVQIQAGLDHALGHERVAAAAPAGAPEAIHRHQMAQQFLKLGMASQAEALLRKLTAEHPEYRPGWVSLGYREVAAGRIEEAKACFEKAAALDANPADMAAGMAWICARKGDTAQSEKWAAAVDGNDPHYELIRDLRNESASGRGK